MFEERNDSSMVKQTKLFALPKFGSLRGSTSASLKIGKNLEKLGVALILRLYLVTDLLLMQTELAKIRSSATRPQAFLIIKMLSYM